MGPTTTKKSKTEILKSKKTDMLRSNSKQSGESVLKKKEKLRWEGFAAKESFKALNERVRGDGILITISMNVRSI